MSLLNHLANNVLGDSLDDVPAVTLSACQRFHKMPGLFCGGLPKIVVPDCLKGAVSRACRYEPELNPTYAEMAEHYGICVLPARPAHPKDKAKVEAGVLIAKRWILSV